VDIKKDDSIFYLTGLFKQEYIRAFLLLFIIVILTIAYSIARIVNVFTFVFIWGYEIFILVPIIMVSIKGYHNEMLKYIISHHYVYKFNIGNCRRINPTQEFVVFNERRDYFDKDEFMIPIINILQENLVFIKYGFLYVLISIPCVFCIYIYQRDSIYLSVFYCLMVYVSIYRIVNYLLWKKHYMK
jgi:hypothetical protein